jgi:hypothetical protein
MQQWGEDYRLERDYELPGIMRKTHVIEATIADDGTESEAIDLRGYSMLGLIVPVIDAANLTFKVAEAEGGTYVTVYDDLGAAFTITAAAGSRAISTDDLAALAGYRWVKIVSSETQTADRLFYWVVKA